MKQFILFIFIAILAFTGCHDVKIGFLKAEGAEYVPDSIVIPAKLVTAEENPWTNDQIRIDNNSPWVTNAISGVLGTEPLQYEFVSVEATEGGDADLFVKEIVVRGHGRMEVPLRPTAPKGRYKVTLKVSNEGHSAILPDIFTFIIE